MRTRLLLLSCLGLLSVGAEAGVIGGGTTGKVSGTQAIINQELAAEIAVDRAQFASVVSDSVNGKVIVIDDEPHVTELVDLKNHQVYLRPLDAAPGTMKVILLKPDAASFDK